MNRDSPPADIASTVQCVIFHCQEQGVVNKINVLTADDTVSRAIPVHTNLLTDA